MPSSNQYPPEKSGNPPVGDSNHQYPPVPIPSDPNATSSGALPPRYSSQFGEGLPPQQYGQPEVKLHPSRPEEGIPPQQPPRPVDADYQYPPPPSAPPPHQEPYQPTSWVPVQNQYDPNHLNQPPPATSTVPGGAVDSAHPDQHGKFSALEKAKVSGKAGFDKLWAGFEKLGVPVNRWTNKIGSEAFWPTSLDKESDKCARILKSFCKDGFYSEPPVDPAAPQDGPKGKPKVLVKIPQKVIQNAVALAIFTTMRTGFWVSGAGGSGVLIARLADGSWSPPSGLLIHTAGVGFMAGIDIYDCVLVINTPEALAAFKKVRLSLGGELSLAAGPVGVGGVGEVELSGDRKRKPVWTYMKSRGLYAGVQIDGSIVLERNDENARYYGERLPAADILAGKLKNVPHSTRLLMEVVKEAEGKKDVNQHVLQEVAQQPAPGDMLLEKGPEATNDQKEKYGNARYA
ncbi:putative SH3 domain-containing YSC84-like protein 1 [Amylocarpus encephaloides]|uniref:SH3 domain-containing YSC84-like protein 1 n=1 Tax=Amylocarpus encephaloides TaxID=45428 RepID=A0A9P7YJU7_9HELO|nr:putative SH3 domain-containing YSC84-like protein 1 [Amylocarpus encephaloides]